MGLISKARKELRRFDDRVRKTGRDIDDQVRAAASDADDWRRENPELSAMIPTVKSDVITPSQNF